MMINYYKGDPNTYTICSRNGEVIRHGAGINFWYSPITTSIAAVPLASQESQFIFNETTADFQEVSIQGSLTYRLDTPLAVAKRLDFTAVSRPSFRCSFDDLNGSSWLRELRNFA